MALLEKCFSYSASAANTYDAWNRATSIRGVTYAYDALGRRIWESANGGRAFFYDGQRMIETRTGPINALSTSAHEQYVYGQGYIDDVILRDAEVNGGGNLGINGSGLDQRIYYQQDREYNVVAITDQSGNVVERYAYDPYGSQSALDPNWNLLSGGSEYGNQIGFTGRWLDDTGMWYFRARYLEPVLGRFVQRDPIGYVNGKSLYNAYFCPRYDDPFGTDEVDYPAVPIDDNGSTGQLQVSNGVELADEYGKKNIRIDYKEKNCNCHFLQFVVAQVLAIGNAGNPKAVTYETGNLATWANTTLVLSPQGKQIVNVDSGSKSDPLYGAAYNEVVTPNEVTMYDSPSDLTQFFIKQMQADQGITQIKMAEYFNAYLVCNKKAKARISWNNTAIRTPNWVGGRFQGSTLSGPNISVGQTTPGANLTDAEWTALNAQYPGQQYVLRN